MNEFMGIELDLFLLIELDIETESSIRNLDLTIMKDLSTLTPLCTISGFLPLIRPVIPLEFSFDPSPSSRLNSTGLRILRTSKGKGPPSISGAWQRCICFMGNHSTSRVGSAGSRAVYREA